MNIRNPEGCKPESSAQTWHRAFSPLICIFSCFPGAAPQAGMGSRLWRSITSVRRSLFLRSPLSSYHHFFTGAQQGFVPPAGQVGFAVQEEQASAFFIGQEACFEQEPEEVSVRLHANPKIAIQARRGRRRIIQYSFVLCTRRGDTKERHRSF